MQSHPLYHCISCDPCDEQTEAQGEEEAPHWAPAEATTQLEFKISAFSKKKKKLYADHSFKFFTESVTILLRFYVLVFWQRGMWDLSSLDRD